MNHKSLLLSTLFTIAPLSFIVAQTDTKTPSPEDKLAKIEAIVNKLPDISGFVNLRYQFTDEKGKYEGFDVRRAYLNLKGNATSALSYRLQVDFAVSPKILDAYAEYKIVDFFNLQAGQFKLPFTLENPISPLTLETSDNSQIIDNLSGGAKDVVSSNGRDIGIQANGKFFPQEGFSFLEYKLGVFNGAGMNTSENNSTKDIVGTIFINPLKALTISGSYFKGRAKTGTVVAGKTVYNNQDRTRFGASVRYDDGTYLVRSEFIKGSDDVIDRQGYYVVGGYYILPQKLQVILKYDTYDRDLDVSDDKTTNYTVGLNYTIIKNTRLQLNYVNKRNQAATTVNYAVAQLIVAF